MTDKAMWYVEQIKRKAEEVRDNNQLSECVRFSMLRYYAGNLDGASAVVEGQPVFFRACCDLRNEIKGWCK